MVKRHVVRQVLHLNFLFLDSQCWLLSDIMYLTLASLPSNQDLIAK